MFQPSRLAFAAAIAVIAAVSYAHGQGASKTADQAWTDLVNLRTPPAASKIRPGNDKAADETKTKIAQQASQSWQASQDARTFYSQNPTHPKATEARKIEAISALQAIKPGDVGQERTALSIASEFRENRSMPATDRCDVALTMDRYRLSQQIKTKVVKDAPVEWVKLADNLKKEFGDLAPLQSYYLEVARKVDPVTAGSIATNVVRSSAATPGVRAEAQSMLERAALIGKPLAMKLPKFGGGEFDLAQQQNKVVALVVWSPADPGSLAALKAMRHNIPAGVEIVYMALGGSAQQLTNAQATMPLAGSYCYAPSVAAGRTFADTLKLKHAPAPSVYVLNRSGTLAGFGRTGDLPGLIAKAVR